VFFRSLSDEHQVFLGFLFAGMASVGRPGVRGVLADLRAVRAGHPRPFFYVLLTFGNRLFVEIALLVPLFYALNVVIAYRLTQVFLSGYRLRHAYGKLTQDHRTLNQRLERSWSSWRKARRQVEASGRKLALFAERAPIAVPRAAARRHGERGQPCRPRSCSAMPRPSWSAAREEAGARRIPRRVRPTWQELIAKRESMAGPEDPQPAARRHRPDLRVDRTPLVNFRHEVIAVIAQGRDVTAQLEAERMKKEFTSTLSHELRTPLTSIIGSLQLINSGVMGDVDKEVGELTTVAERNGQRLLDLINDLLDIEKIESGKLSLAPELIAPDDLVREAMMLNKAFGERFTCASRRAASCPAAWCSPTASACSR
jgi:hypothetical protein